MSGPEEELPRGDVTQLLGALDAGDDAAAQRLLPLVYGELHQIASKAFRQRAGHHTLQPTILVHDAYLKMLGHAGGVNDRKHFFVVAAMAMRQMLADHARSRSASKRGGEWQRVSMEGLQVEGQGEELDLTALHVALEKLSALAPRQARVVELRFLAGLEVPEVAELLGVSERTVVSEWRTARAFLRTRMNEEE